MRDKIAVRTPRDKEREEHEERVLEKFRRENANPIQSVGGSVWDFVGGAYRDYIYSSGVMLIAFSLWSMYPSFVRYRHLHIKRYRRNQLVVRRWFLGSVHLPKWDKKCLQRILVPPPPQPQARADLHNAASSADGSLARALEGITTGAVAKAEASNGGLAMQPPPDDKVFVYHKLSTRHSAKAAFDNAYEAKSAAMIDQALHELNETVYSSHAQFQRAVDIAVDLSDIKSRIEAAVRKSEACVVLKEDHTTVRSIPPGWEVWWVSAEEQKRRNTCKFWLFTLACCRAMQDLLNMPDMPTVIQ